MEYKCICIDCPNKCFEYYKNGISDKAYYEWSIKLDKCKTENKATELDSENKR